MLTVEEKRLKRNAYSREWKRSHPQEVKRYNKICAERKQRPTVAADIIDKIGKKGYLMWTTGARLTQVKNAAAECPIEVLQYLEQRNTKILSFTRAYTRKQISGFANEELNIIGLLTGNKRNKLHSHTIIHETVHLAKKDLTRIGEWNSMEEKMFAIGEELYNTIYAAAHIEPDDFFAKVCKKWATSIIDKIQLLITVRSPEVGNIAARSFRTRAFTEIIVMAKIAKLQLPEIGSCFNARWLGMCLVAYVEKLVNKKITTWNNIEETIAERISFDNDLAKKVFSLLLSKTVILP